MRLNSSDFQNCGFIEQFMFWSIFVSGLIFVVTFILLHLHVRDDFKWKGFYPLIILIFIKDAFDSRGKFYRMIFFISGIGCLILCLTLYFGYELSFFSCGGIRED